MDSEIFRNMLCVLGRLPCGLVEVNVQYHTYGCIMTVTVVMTVAYYGEANNHASLSNFAISAKFSSGTDRYVRVPSIGVMQCICVY